MKKEYVRTFDINRRLAIPRKILAELGIDYETDQMTIKIVDNKIVLEKLK